MLLIVSLFSFANALPILIAVTLVLIIVRAKRQPLWAEAYRRLGQNRLALVALAVISFYGIVAVLDSISWQDNRAAEPQSILDRLSSHIPVERTYSAPFATMTTGEPHSHPLIGKHILGTDGSGRDILIQTLKGCRTAMIIGGFTTLLIIPVALILGMAAGYYGKRIDDAIQYLYTVMASIPNILLLIALVLVLGRTIPNLCLSLGITGWVELCRLIRGETLKHRDREYVRAARALGMSDARILLKHILPNLLPIVIISITLGFSGLVLNETILSYLGIGVPAGVGSWGNMIDAARNELTREPIIWWNLVSASTALFVLVLAFNFLGDVLRDAIDPRLRSS